MKNYHLVAIAILGMAFMVSAQSAWNTYGYDINGNQGYYYYVPQEYPSIAQQYQAFPQQYQQQYAAVPTPVPVNGLPSFNGAPPSFNGGPPSFNGGKGPALYAPLLPPKHAFHQPPFHQPHHQKFQPVPVVTTPVVQPPVVVSTYNPYGNVVMNANKGTPIMTKTNFNEQLPDQVMQTAGYGTMAVQQGVIKPYVRSVDQEVLHRTQNVITQETNVIDQPIENVKIPIDVRVQSTQTTLNPETQVTNIIQPKPFWTIGQAQQEIVRGQDQTVQRPMQYSQNVVAQAIPNLSKKQ